MSYVYVAMTIIFTVYGQIVIKWRMTTKGALPEPIVEKLIFLIRALFDPWIITGFAAAVVAALAWMAAMTRLKLNHAYPFVSLTFPLVLVFSAVLLNEEVNLWKVGGVALIMLGIVVSSQG